MLSLGSNVGDRLGHLRLAVTSAVAHSAFTNVRWSPVYETDPVGGPAQGDFLNAVVVADTDSSPHDVLAVAHTWESVAGRERGTRWGPRTLDVDVITVDDLRQHDRDLTLPHPLAHERAFVLAPWHDLEPEARLSGHGRVIELLANLHHAGVRRRDDLDLTPLDEGRP